MPDGYEIGAGGFSVIAGSCAVESFEQIDEVGAALSARGVRIMRGMAYKPRTSPYEFQGLGEPGLQIARQVADKYNMYVVSEIMDLSQIPMMLDYVDMFWVGARNMQNSFLLKALGKIDRPVILKNGLAATMEEFLYAAEYIVSSGNPNVMLIMRGIRTYEKWTRNTLDMGTIAVLKQESHLPVIVDISHCVGAARHRQAAGAGGAGAGRGRLDGRSPSQSAGRHERRQAAAHHPRIQRHDGRNRPDGVKRFDAKVKG